MRYAKLYQYRLPIETGVVLRQRPLTVREGLLLQLAEKGREGWGEIAPLPEFSREDLTTATQQARSWLKGWLQNQPVALANYAPSVAFGISCALAELNGKLGQEGNFQAVPLCTGDPKQFYEKLAHIKGEKIAKIKVGFDKVENDGLLVNQFLDATPDLKLRLDANRAWTLAQALAFGEKIAVKHRSRIQFIEEPCQTPALSLQFATQTQINIAWDETVREAGFVVKKQPNVTACIIKPTLTGSLQHCVALIEQAHQNGQLAVISSSLESSLGLSQLARIAHQYTANTQAGLDTLNLMQHQLLRKWQGSPLPLVDLTSPFVSEVPL